MGVGGPLLLFSLAEQKEYTDISFRNYRSQLKILEARRVTKQVSYTEPQNARRHIKKFVHFLLCRELNTYVQIPRPYDCLRALIPLLAEAHSSLSTAFCRHLLTFISCRSFSNVFKPSQSWSSHFPTSLWFTLKYFLNWPSMIRSYYMSNPFQTLFF
jgi:hypothetical protein